MGREAQGAGRNPGMPWKTQSPLIDIDADRDYISDRGDEVWNVLATRRIRNIVLVGVHLNMCVLGGRSACDRWSVAASGWR